MSWIVDLGVVLLFVGLQVWDFIVFAKFKREVNGRLESIESMLYGLNEETFSDYPADSEVE